MKLDRRSAGQHSSESTPIDIVITWVDGSDREWLEEKSKYLPISEASIDATDRRYRDWNLLKYLFRGIEQFAPWVHKVYFVTWGHLPKWLNLSAKKLVIVKHEDYMPREFLPTFSSHPIELNLHRIEGLSEQFVYFNDDTFILRTISPSLFFKHALPVLPPQLHGILPRGDTGVMAHVYVNNISALNRHFEFKRTIFANKGKWFNPLKIGSRAVAENAFCCSYEEFPGFRHCHLPMPLLKSTIEEVWDKEYDVLYNTCLHKFRSIEDVSPYIFWQWQLAKGDFIPCKVSDLGARFTINEQTLSAVERVIRSRQYNLICPNDMGGFESDTAFEECSVQLANAFESILPYKSRFEL